MNFPQESFAVAGRMAIAGIKPKEKKKKKWPSADHLPYICIDGPWDPKFEIVRSGYE